MLPVVSRELKGSILQSMKSDPNYFKQMYTHMKNTNPVLWEIMCSTAFDGGVDRELKDWFLKGAFIVYAMLVSQEECDEMRREFG